MYLFQDFVASAVITLLWLVASAAWAQGLVNLKYYTDLSSSGTFEKVPTCNMEGCVEKTFPNFGSLNASVVSSFMKCYDLQGNEFSMTI